MTKVQESKILGYTTIEGKKVPIVQPEVHERIYCKNCDNEVDSEEQAVGTCSDCGQDWSVHKAKDIQVKVVQIPMGSGTG
jgi:Zn finger protein HypA/HybF involved in hydrogenase expression